MLRKLFVFGLITLLNFSSISIIDIDIFANATSGGDIYLDTQYIYNITENLSNVIYKAYNNSEIPKGRYFGSKGEQYAAEDIIGPNMSILNLIDPLGSYLFGYVLICHP